jgi:hypothetical protein
MRRSAVALVGVVIAFAVARVAAPLHASHLRYSAALGCGVERWKVKDAAGPAAPTPCPFDSDRSADHARPTNATTGDEASLRAAHLQRRRRGDARHAEADDDFHLVLQSGADQMIAESPSSSCARGATPYRRRQMRAARTKLRLCSHVRVVGVAFFDF